mgnify:FL=1
MFKCHHSQNTKKPIALQVKNDKLFTNGILCRIFAKIGVITMSFTGHICDVPAAYRATRSALVGDTNLSMGTSDITTVAVAEAAAVTNAQALHVSERFFGINTARGFRIADNLDATFGSTFSVLYASLPDNANLNKSMMISGS